MIVLVIDCKSRAFQHRADPADAVIAIVAVLFEIIAN
jgi:hypothetical protein